MSDDLNNNDVDIEKNDSFDEARITEEIKTDEEIVVAESSAEEEVNSENTEESSDDLQYKEIANNIIELLKKDNDLEFDGDKLVITPREKKEKSRVPVVILSIALALAVLFIGFQSVFIWKLTTGQLEKNSMLPVTSSSSSEDKKNKKEVSSAINPNFSLEEAASINDPNKKTLSTVEIYNKVYPATVTIYIKGEADGVETILGAGSGFILTEDGYIVTNEHVIEGATAGIEVNVPFYDEPFSAELVGADIQTDIAIIKIESDKKLPVVTLGDSDVLQNGELAVAIGSPLGSFEGTITVGVVSGVERPMNNNGYSMNLIQTDASVNSGNSGGALINSFGEVIGVVNAKISSAEGLGFAIPINSVKGIIESLIVNGKVIDRPYLGVIVMYVSPDSYFGAVEGVFVNDFKEGGPGDQAGIEVGDRIVSMDGVEIKQSSDIILVRDSHKCGDSISVVVERNGEKVELTLVIGDSADYDE